MIALHGSIASSPDVTAMYLRAAVYDSDSPVAAEMPYSVQCCTTQVCLAVLSPHIIDLNA